MANHRVWQPACPIPLDRLRLVKFSYYDFNEIEHHDGKIIVLDAVAKRVRLIFKELHTAKFPISKANPIEYYKGNDAASMTDNNTCCFNCREITSGGLISIHSYGLAIDINPMQNPFVRIRKGKFDSTQVKPSNATAYIDREALKPGMAETVVNIFKNNGFTEWGGNWKTIKDWQHFQTPRVLAQTLAKMSPMDAKNYFESYIKAQSTNHS